MNEVHGVFFTVLYAITCLYFLCGQLRMLSICLSYLFHALWPGGESVRGRRQEVVNSLHFIRDGASQRGEQGIKQLLNMIIDCRLHRRSRNTNAVNLNVPVRT